MLPAGKVRRIGLRVLHSEAAPLHLNVSGDMFFRLELVEKMFHAQALHTKDKI